MQADVLNYRDIKLILFFSTAIVWNIKGLRHRVAKFKGIKNHCLRQNINSFIYKKNSDIFNPDRFNIDIYIYAGFLNEKNLQFNIKHWSRYLQYMEFPALFSLFNKLDKIVYKIYILYIRYIWVWVLRKCGGYESRLWTRESLVAARRKRGVSRPRKYKHVIDKIRHFSNLVYIK